MGNIIVKKQVIQTSGVLLQHVCVVLPAPALREHLPQNTHDADFKWDTGIPMTGLGWAWGKDLTTLPTEAADIRNLQTLLQLGVGKQRSSSSSSLIPTYMNRQGMKSGEQARLSARHPTEAKATTMLTKQAGTWCELQAEVKWMRTNEQPIHCLILPCGLETRPILVAHA